MPKYIAKKAIPTATSTIEAYVPAKDRHGRLIGSDEWASAIASVERAVCSVTGGGCTSYGAHGVWAGSREPVRVVRGSFPVHRRAEAVAAVSAAVGVFAAETNQEAAGFTLDGEWYWVVADAPAVLAVG